MSRQQSFVHAILHPILLYVVLVWTILPDAQHQARAQSAHTRVRLVSDAAAVAPGKSMTVGVLLRMDEGWHIYWANPGESGLATAVQWKVPPGTVVSELHWPLPEKKIEDGDVLTYGYSGETMLIATVQLPPTIASEKHVTIQADVSWLECKNSCVPGNASATLVLPVRAGLSPSADAVVIERYRRALPVLLTAQKDVTIDATEASDTVAIAVTPVSETSPLRASTVDFFPASGDVPTGARTTVAERNRDVVVRVPVASRQTDSSALRGIVVYTTAAGSRKGVEFTYLRGGTTSLLDRQFVTAERAGEDAPLILYLSFALIGGLLLNVMPCVLPVVALKVFGLVKMAGDEPRKVRRLGWMFSLGILASFLILALIVVLLKVAGQQVDGVSNSRNLSLS